MKQSFFPFFLKGGGKTLKWVKIVLTTCALGQLSLLKFPVLSFGVLLLFWWWWWWFFFFQSLTLWLRLAWNFQRSSCLSLPSTRVTVVSYKVWLWHTSPSCGLLSNLVLWLFTLGSWFLRLCSTPQLPHPWPLMAWPHYFSQPFPASRGDYVSPNLHSPSVTNINQSAF